MLQPPVRRRTNPSIVRTCDRSTAALLFYTGKTAHPAVAGQAGPWLQRLFSLNCEYRMPRVLLFSLTDAARQIFGSAAPASPRLDAPLPCRSRTTPWLGSHCHENAARTLDNSTRSPDHRVRSF